MRNVTALITLLFPLLFSLSRCSEPYSEQPVDTDTTEYLVLNNWHSDFVDNAAISTYSKPNGVSTKKFEFNAPRGDYFSDLVLSGDNLYGVRFVSDTVDIITQANMSVVKSIGYGGHVDIGWTDKHIAVTDKKIFISTWSWTDNGMGSRLEAYLKVLNLDNLNRVDSIHVLTDEIINSILVANGKLFVSAGDISVGTGIYIFDLITYKLLNTIKIQHRCFSMIQDKNNNIIAFSNGGFTLINGIELSIMKVRSIEISPPSNSTCSSPYALDKEKNILYFMRNVAQPAATPYVLGSYDFASDSIKTITDNITPSTLSFNEKKKLILIATTKSPNPDKSGIIRMLTTSGKIVEEFAVPNIASKVIVKP